MPAPRNGITLLVIATAVVGFDQISKSAIVVAAESRTLSLFNGWVTIEYTVNRGAAFGLFTGLAPLLPALSVVILAGLLIRYLMQARPAFWETVAVGLIAGGAAGNLIDRIRLGYVVDFVAIGPWPNFNLADSAITVGVVLLIWGCLRSEPTLRVANASEQESEWRSTES